MFEVQFFIGILFFEIAIVALLLVSLIFRKIWEFFDDRWELRARQTLTRTLVECLVDNKTIHSCKRIHSFRSSSVLLQVLEDFDRKFSGNSWEGVKYSIYSSCLSNRAKKYAKSYFWKKRNFSARCFALCPTERDRDIILRLMDDPNFLVSGSVASAVVVLEEKEGVYKIIHKMIQLKGYAYYYYRDILLQGSQKVYHWIEEFAAQDQNTEFYIACLDVLEHVCFKLNKLNIKKDLQSKDDRVHLAALNLLIHNPQPYSLKAIAKEINGEDPHMRAEAVIGLEHFLTPRSLRRLRGALKDPDREVRISAAEVLKKSGRKGMRILREQNLRSDRKAYESAQFALKFL